MSVKKMNTQRGFTIVELLIVIVVIAILAAISIVAFTGIQERARKTQLASDINSIKKAMEIYRVSEGEYPRCPSGAECGYASNIRPQLVPDFVSELSEYNFAYVFYPHESTRWAMRYQANREPYDLPETCKFGVNMFASWYGSAPEC